MTNVKYICCLSALLILLNSCSFLHFSENQSKYKNPFIIDQVKEADELIKNGITFNAYSVSDGITNDGGGYSSMESYSSDGVKIEEVAYEYKSLAEARAKLEDLAEKLKDSEAYERIKGEEDQGDIIIATENSNKQSATIVSINKMTTQKVQAPALKYALAFSISKQNK